MNKPTVVGTTFQEFPQSRKAGIEAKQRESDPFANLPGKRAASAMEVNGISTARIPGVDPRHMEKPVSTVAETISVEAPAFVNAISEAEAVVLDLPSRYAFYDFKDLYVKPFKGIHLAKLSKAREESSILHMVEAVSSVLSTTTGGTALAFKLTLPDFYFVLYWLRLNSFTKSVFTHTTTCPDEEHIKKVTKGELAADTLRITEIIRKSSLETIMLDSVPNPEVFQLAYPGVTLVPPTMFGAIAITEHPQFNDAEFRFAAKYAVYLNLGKPSSLEDKIAVVNDMSPDDIETIKEYEKAVSEYGINETIQVKCKCCGKTKTDKIKIEAHSFFP